MLDFHARFRLRSVWFDPYQCVQMGQTFTRNGLFAQPMNFVGKNLDRMASALLESFATPGFVNLYNDAALIRDLQRLSIVEKSYGYKLESVRDADGHADAGIAFAIGLPEAVRIAGLQSPHFSPPQMLNLQSPAPVWMTAGLKPTRVIRRLENRPTYRKFGTF